MDRLTFHTSTITALALLYIVVFTQSAYDVFDLIVSGICAAYVLTNWQNLEKDYFSKFLVYTILFSALIIFIGTICVLLNSSNQPLPAAFTNGNLKNIFGNLDWIEVSTVFSSFVALSLSFMKFPLRKEELKP